MLKSSLPNTGELADLFGLFSSKRVLVIGDLMLDSYLYGSVTRISPEAPVPIVDVKRESQMLGGSGNVAANIVALGGRADVVGLVGDDAKGERVLSLLDDLSIERDGVIRERGRLTTEKCRIIGGTQQVVRVDSECCDPVSDKVHGEIWLKIRNLIPRADAIIFSDYMKGVVTRSLVEYVLREKGDCLCAVDPKEPTMRRYKGIDLVKPNLAAARRAVEHEVDSEASLREAAEVLYRGLDCKYLMITRGSEGMSLFDADKGYRHIPTRVRRVFDVSGAGDTVLSAVTLSLAAGGSIDTAAQIANLAGGIVVEKVGTATVTRDELLHKATERGADKLE